MVEAAELGWLEITGRLAAAGVLGGLLGLEREYDGQDAGFRTHLLVVLGAAVFGVASVGAFADFLTVRADTNLAVDVTRIASYVAPGVGFIGGGAILKHGGQVSGITTAASLWSAAAIGLASGLGAWSTAVVATAIALFALEALQPVSRLVSRMGRSHRSMVVIEVTEEADLSRIVSEMRGAVSGKLKLLRYGSGPDEGEIVADFWRPPEGSELVDLADRLRTLDGVRNVTVRPSG